MAFEGLIEEYKSLREEILRRQDRMMAILGLTITGSGAVMGFVLKSPTKPDFDWYRFGLLSVLLLLLSAATFLTANHIFQIAVIASYIGYYVESTVPHMGWERRLQLMDSQSGYRLRAFMGIQKFLAACYGTIGIGSLAIGIGLTDSLRNSKPAVVLLALLGLPLGMALVMLSVAKDRGIVNWESVERRRDNV